MREQEHNGVAAAPRPALQRLESVGEPQEAGQSDDSGAQALLSGERAAPPKTETGGDTEEVPSLVYVRVQSGAQAACPGSDTACAAAAAADAGDGGQPPPTWQAMVQAMVHKLSQSSSFQRYANGVSVDALLEQQDAGLQGHTISELLQQPQLSAVLSPRTTTTIMEAAGGAAPVAASLAAPSEPPALQVTLPAADLPMQAVLQELDELLSHPPSRPGTAHGEPGSAHSSSSSSSRNLAASRGHSRGQDSSRQQTSGASPCGSWRAIGGGKTPSQLSLELGGSSSRAASNASPSTRAGALYQQLLRNTAGALQEPGRARPVSAGSGARAGPAVGGGGATGPSPASPGALSRRAQSASPCKRAVQAAAPVRTSLQLHMLGAGSSSSSSSTGPSAITSSHIAVTGSSSSSSSRRATRGPSLHLAGSGDKPPQRQQQTQAPSRVVQQVLPTVAASNSSISLEQLLPAAQLQDAAASEQLAGAAAAAAAVPPVMAGIHETAAELLAAPHILRHATSVSASMRMRSSADVASSRRSTRGPTMSRCSSARSQGSAAGGSSSVGSPGNSSSSSSRVWRPGGNRTSSRDDNRKLATFESAHRAMLAEQAAVGGVDATTSCPGSWPAAGDEAQAAPATAGAAGGSCSSQQYLTSRLDLSSNSRSCGQQHSRACAAAATAEAAIAAAQQVLQQHKPALYRAVTQLRRRGTAAPLSSRSLPPARTKTREHGSSVAKQAKEAPAASQQAAAAASAAKGAGPPSGGDGSTEQHAAAPAQRRCSRSAGSSLVRQLGAFVPGKGAAAARSPHAPRPASTPPWSAPRRRTSNGLTADQLLAQYRRSSTAEPPSPDGGCKAAGAAGAESTNSRVPPANAPLDAMVRAYTALVKQRSAADKAAALAALMNSIKAASQQQLQQQQQQIQATAQASSSPAAGSGADPGDNGAGASRAGASRGAAASAAGLCVEGTRLDVLLGDSSSHYSSMQQHEAGGAVLSPPPPALMSGSAGSSPILSALKSSEAAASMRSSPEKQAAHSALLATPTHKRPGSYAAGLAALTCTSHGNIAAAAERLHTAPELGREGAGSCSRGQPAPPPGWLQGKLLLRGTATGRAVLQGVDADVTLSQAVDRLRGGLTRIASSSCCASPAAAAAASRPAPRMRSRPCSPFVCFGGGRTGSLDGEDEDDRQQGQQQLSMQFLCEGDELAVVLVQPAAGSQMGAAAAVSSSRLRITGVALPAGGDGACSLELVTDAGRHTIQLDSLHDRAAVLAGLNAMLLLQEQPAAAALRLADAPWSVAVQGVAV